MSDITEHLTEHERAIVGLARRTALRYRLSRDLADDIAQVGRIALWKRHQDGFDHARASLLTASYRSVLFAMNAAAKEQADGPIPVDPTDTELWDAMTEGATFRGPGHAIIFAYGATGRDDAGEPDRASSSDAGRHRQVPLAA